jgi:hypothetical protein
MDLSSNIKSVIICLQDVRHDITDCRSYLIEISETADESRTEIRIQLGHPMNIKSE